MEEDFQEWSGRIVGGSTASAGQFRYQAANLQWVSLRTLTNADCRSRFSTANAARVHDNTICTFTRAGQGTCKLNLLPSFLLWFISTGS
jgi:hypothetical protein